VGQNEITASLRVKVWEVPRGRWSWDVGIHLPENFGSAIPTEAYFI
jgi:hypothetical protein